MYIRTGNGNCNENGVRVLICNEEKQLIEMMSISVFVNKMIGSVNYV